MEEFNFLWENEYIELDLHDDATSEPRVEGTYLLHVNHPRSQVGSTLVTIAILGVILFEAEGIAPAAQQLESAPIIDHPDALRVSVKATCSRKRKKIVVEDECEEGEGEEPMGNEQAPASFKGASATVVRSSATSPSGQYMTTRFKMPIGWGLANQRVERRQQRTPTQNLM